MKPRQLVAFSVAVLLVLVVLTSCSRAFRFSEAAIDELPMGLKESMPTEGVLRAVLKQGRDTLIAWTQQSTSVRAEILQWYIFPYDGTPTIPQDWYRYQGTLLLGWEKYDWDLDCGFGDLKYIAAFGVALDAAGREVVAETSERHTVRGQVVNGFWYLRLEAPGPGEIISKVDLLDHKGRVLYTYRPD